MKNLNNDMAKILINEYEVQGIVKNIAAQIDELYEREGYNRLLLLGILKGSVVFMGDLMKHIKTPVEIDFMKVSSYGASTKSSKNINIILDLLRNDLQDIDILIVEDIIDSGKTLSYLVDYLKLKGARSVRTCTLLDKPDRREVDFKPEITGVEIPDEFVVGYGLDFAEKYRALPYIGVLKPEIYENIV